LHYFGVGRVWEIRSAGFELGERRRFDGKLLYNAAIKDRFLVLGFGFGYGGIETHGNFNLLSQVYMLSHILIDMNMMCLLVPCAPVSIRCRPSHNPTCRAVSDAKLHDQRLVASPPSRRPSA
jgi:hypothetical protein